MNGWFIALLVIYVLNLGVELGKHGKPREGKHNFWLGVVGSLIGVFLVYMAIKTGF